MPRVEVDRHLLFGLLALQTGLIDQGALFMAFNAWTRDKARSMGEILVAQGDLDAAHCSLLEGLVAVHLKMHGDDPEKSPAAIEAGRSTRERLAQINDCELTASVALIGSNHHPFDIPVDHSRPKVVTPSSDGPPSDRQEQLLAEQHGRWAQGECILVEAFLERDPDLRDDPDALLDLIYNEVVLREQRGEAPEPDEYFGRFPELKDAIRNQFEIHRMFAGQGPASSGGTAERTPTFSVGSSSSRGLRFRVLRPHRSGGLGAVFVALDTELHREVALKQILDRLADDPVSRSRFLVEAEIAGGLEHPGIVPVYGLGTYGRGRPFYAMRFIRGDSLKDAITTFHADESLKRDPGRRSLELRKLLRRFLDVCNAIEYAHSRGVLYRDIKPGNIIVGKHGETLVVDWGLAKAVGRFDPGADSEERTLVPSSASGSAETLPGSAPGTPAFMSPEQAAGDLARLGPRSDVYSLGATLYILLTGRPPFEGNDVGAVLEAVWLGGFPRPSKHDASIDRALEAICLKAMARSPDDRYASPRALADDIERWTADEPVTAWREPFARRARRWGKRNRTAVTAAAAALVVALLGTAAVLAVQTRANANLRISNGLLSAANARDRKLNAELAASNDRERARFALALDAIKLFHGEVSQDLLLKEKQFDSLRTKLLRGAADFNGKLEALLKGHTDRPSRAALAKAYTELADLTAEIGNVPEALAEFRKALAIQQKLADDNPAVIGFQHDLARSHYNIGLMQSRTGDEAGALRSYGRALTILEKLADAYPAVTEFQNDLARNYYVSGDEKWATGDITSALQSYHRAVAIGEKLVAANPTVTKFQSDLVLSHRRIGNIQLPTGDTAGALQSYQRALTIIQKLADANPAITEFQLNLARSYSNIGQALRDNGDMAGALQSHRRAVAIEEKLAGAYPAVTEFQSELALSRNNLGVMLSRMGKPAEALAAYKAAVAIEKKLADANPADTQLQARAALAYNNIGVTLSQMAKPAETLAAYKAARAIIQKLADANPGVIDFQRLLADSHLGIGWLLYRAGKPAEALEPYRQALAIFQKLADANPSNPSYRTGLANMLTNTSEMLRLEHRLDEARAACRRAIALRENLVKAAPGAIDDRNGLRPPDLRDFDLEPSPEVRRGLRSNRPVAGGCRDT